MIYKAADPNELAKLDAAGWSVQDDKIAKIFKFKSFAKAWAWMDAVAAEAERINHHPDWSNSYNRVEVGLTTHATGGLSHLDVALAKFMDHLPRA